MLRAHSFPFSAVSKRPLLATENTFSQDVMFPSCEPKCANHEFYIFLNLDLTPLMSIQSIQIIQNHFPLPPTSPQVASMAQCPHSFLSPSDHIRCGLALNLVHKVPRRPRRMGLRQRVTPPFQHVASGAGSSMDSSLLTAHWPEHSRAVAHYVAGKHVDQMARLVNTMVSQPQLGFISLRVPFSLLSKHTKCFPTFEPWHPLLSVRMLT